MISLFGIFSKKKAVPHVPKGILMLELTGSPGTFNVTYNARDHKTVQKHKVESGWSYSYNGKSGEYYFVSAQANERNATITLRAIKEGEVLSETTQTGDYVIASVSGSIP